MLVSSRLRLRTVLVVLVIGFTAGALPGSAAAEPTPACYRGPDENSYYRIANVVTGKALNVSHRSHAAGAPVIQWEYSGATNEQWRPICVAPFAYKFVARHSGLVLDVAGGSTADGAAVLQYRYRGGANQQWTIGRVGSVGDLVTFELRNRGSGKVLDAADDGLGVHQSPGDHTDPRRLWTLEQVGAV